MANPLAQTASGREARSSGDRGLHVRHVEAATVRVRLELVGEADHRLGGAQHEIAVALDLTRQTVEHDDLGVLIEVDQHVAAEHDIECAKRREIIEQVERPELHHRADLGRKLPAFADLREMLDQQLDRQPALHLELAVKTGFGLLQHLGGEISGQNVDAPAGKARAHVLEHHGQRIRLLAARGRRAPDAHALLHRARLHQRGHDGVAEMIERDAIAEEEGLVGHHGLDHVHDQRLRILPLEIMDEGGQAIDAYPAGDRHEPALDQVLLVLRQDEPGPLLQEPPQIVEFEWGHDLLPEKRRMTIGAMRSSGSTSEHKPAWVTDPGMPQTTLVASSCAITALPAAVSTAAPLVPSQPMPVRTTARHLPPHTSAAEANNGSTEGLQKLTSGPSLSAIMAWPSRRSTRMWRPPGAI